MIYDCLLKGDYLKETDYVVWSWDNTVDNSLQSGVAAKHSQSYAHWVPFREAEVRFQWENFGFV